MDLVCSRYDKEIRKAEINDLRYSDNLSENIFNFIIRYLKEKQGDIFY